MGLLILPFIFVLVLAFWIRNKMPEWKGKYSERLVYRKMLRLPDEYTIFNDLLFENNGYSTQIDHLVVSPYGVFVIETKGYKGWILGGEYSEKWRLTRKTLCLTKDHRQSIEKEVKIYNPS